MHSTTTATNLLSWMRLRGNKVHTKTRMMMTRIVKLHQTDGRSSEILNYILCIRPYKHVLKQKPNFKLNKHTKFNLNLKLLSMKCGFILKAVKLYNKLELEKQATTTVICTWCLTQLWKNCYSAITQQIQGRYQFLSTKMCFVRHCSVTKETNLYHEMHFSWYISLLS